ncbi:MAG: alpha/beta fold hydrolase [Novosphingobium sp.]
MEAQIAEQALALRARDGIALAVRKWNAPDLPVRAVMVVAHGMGEHSGRYRGPLGPVIASGVQTYALDHRGHGQSIVPGGEPGDYGPGGFAGVVSDLHALVLQARAENPGLPLILLGHSMGSMMTQAFVLDHSDAIDGLVLTGSAAVDVLAAAGATNPAILESLNIPFEPARTPFDWLSRDEHEVDLYLTDPLCGFGLTPTSFIELFSQGAALADPARIAAIRHDLPIWMASGDQDPLHSMLNALTPLTGRYRAAGLDLSTTLYPGARHEILKETNRDEVIGDLMRFIDTIGPVG